MRITTKDLKFFWKVIFPGLVISYIGNHISNFVNDPMKFAVLLFIIVLIALFSWKSYKNSNRKHHEQEFRLFTEAKDLIPKQLQFKNAQPGDILNNSDRPYYDSYIERKLIPYDSGSSVNEVAFSEQDLVDLFEQGKSILLIGQSNRRKNSYFI